MSSDKSYFQSLTMVRSIVIVACLLAATNASPLSREFLRRHPNVNIYPNGKIVGGAVTTIDKVPHQVALEDSGYLFCGGSVISENYVLTAAHCTDGSSASDISIRTGSAKLETGGTVTKVASFVQNPDYDSDTTDYDASVLKLAKPLDLSGAAPKAISLRKQEAKAGETATVTGWGTLHSGDFDLPANLHTVNVPVVSRANCKSAYDDTSITTRMICAGEAGKDSCQGDSGGAITVGGAQVGIVSWGYGCADAGYPGVYGNVANEEMAAFISKNSNNEAVWV